MSRPNERSAFPQIPSDPAAISQPRASYSTASSLVPHGVGGQRMFLDKARNMYFYHDERTDEYVYQDGHRTPVPRQPTLPRTATSPGSAPPNGLTYAHPLALGQTPHEMQQQTSYGGYNTLSTASDPVDFTRPPSSQIYDRAGVRVIDTQNPHNHVRTTFGVAPADRITDPTLYKSGVRAHRMLYGTGEGEAETLYSTFRLRKHKFFCVGRVFLILWAEPAGERAGSVITNVEPSDQSVTFGAFNERVFSKVRRFVVIKEGDSYCTALPITTYGGLGVGKPRVKKSEHAIIHTGREAPSPRAQEHTQRAEPGMKPIPIRVIPDDPTDALNPMCRLDFGKVHTIQHNIKVRAFGMVHQDSMNALLTQFASVWSNTAAPAPTVTGQSTKPAGHLAQVTTSLPTTKPGAPLPVPILTSGEESCVSSAEPVDEDSDESEGDETDEDNVSEDQDSDDDEQERTISNKDDVYPSTGAAWRRRAEQARNAVKRMIEQGYTREQAFKQLVASIQSNGRSHQTAHREAQQLLTGIDRTGAGEEKHAQAHTFGPRVPGADTTRIPLRAATAPDNDVAGPEPHKDSANNRLGSKDYPRDSFPPTKDEWGSAVANEAKVLQIHEPHDHGSQASSIRHPPNSSTAAPSHQWTASNANMPTDSGYASMGRQDESITKSDQHTASAERDSQTIVSDDESVIFMTGKAKLRSIAAFAVEIFDRLPANVWVDEKQCRSIEILLQDALKEFSTAVRSERRGELPLKGAKFISQQRCRIASLLVCGHANVDTCDEPDRAAGASEYSSEDAMKRWLQQMGSNGDPNSIPVVKPSDSLDGDDDEDVDRVIDEARPFLIGTPAFENLVAVVTTILEPFFAPGLGLVTSGLKSKIDQSVSRVRFCLNWNPARFLKDNYPNLDPNDLMDILAITHVSEGRYQAATCGEYLSQTWPSVAATTVPLFRSIFGELAEKGTAIASDNGIAIGAMYIEDDLVLEIAGPSMQLIRIGEQLAWLGAACRSPEQSTIPLYIRPRVTFLEQKTNRPVSFKIWYDKTTSSEFVTTPKTTGYCWLDLFQGLTMVDGFPIPARHAAQPGLEIPFEIMASIGEVDSVDMFEGRLVLKGHSRMFVAVKKLSESIIWHLIKFDEPDANPYEAVLEIETDDTIDMTCITSCRHFLGWTEDVTVNFGTRAANYDIQPANIGLNPSQLSMTSFSISASKYLGVSAQFVRGRKETLPVNGPSTYKLKMDGLRRKRLMIYDDRRKQAWMLGADRVLLHTLRSRIAARHSDSQHFAVKDFTYASGAPDQDVSSILKDQNFIERTLDQELTAPCTEFERVDGVLKMKETWKCTTHRIKDEILELHDTFQKMIAYQGKMNSESRMNVTCPSKPTLQAWSFDNLVQGIETLIPRVVDLQSHAQAWMPFREAILAPVLVGGGFGAVLTPAKPKATCQSWTTMPEALDCMAAPIHVLKGVYQDHGNQANGNFQLIAGLRWHQSETPFKNCKCTKTQRSRKCHKLQDLFDSFTLGKAKSPRWDVLEAYPKGAFIFGRSSRLERMQSSRESMSSSKDVCSDSGLGASISSSHASQERAVPLQA